MAEPRSVKPVSQETRDIALGQFMHAWSDLEASLRRLLGLLTGTPPTVAQAIAAAIPDLGRTKELLVALGAAHLDSAEQKELKELCKYLSISAIHRNHIVHGRWGITGTVTHRYGEGGSEITSRAEWVRVYVVIDPERESDAVAGLNKADREKYVFTVERLRERTEKVAQFSKRVTAFAEKIKDRHWGDRWPPAKSFPPPRDKAVDPTS